jgi:MFS superfamily sulfate permease-like transporter
MLIPGVLNLIPLSALAAILIIVGFKLTKPSLFREIYRQGLRQIIPFIVTIVAILFTDLLIGILIGLAVGAFNILLANYLVSFQASSQKGALGNAFVLRLSEHMSILNKPSLLRAFREIPEGTKVIIDAADTHFIDYDVLEVIHNFKETASARNISVRLINIPDLETPSSSH